MDTSAIDRKKAEIIAKAWTNQEYRRQLVANPKDVIAGEFAVDIPTEIDVKVLVDTPDTEHLVLVQPGFLPVTEQPTAQMGLVYKAWTDPDFKSALLADPRAAFSDYLKFPLPDKPALKVVEQTDNAFFIVIPQRPENLADSELDQVAGGSGAGTYIMYGGMTIVGGSTGPFGVFRGLDGLLGDKDIQSRLNDRYPGFGTQLSHAVHEVANLPGTVVSKVASGIKSIFHGW